LSIGTRYGSFVILFIPSAIILSRFLRNFNLPVLIGTLVVSLVIIIPHLAIRHGAPLAFLNNSWIEHWSIMNFFRSTFITQDGFAEYSVPNIIYSFFNWLHPAFLITGLLFLGFAKHIEFRRNTIRILCGSVFVYAIFIAGIPYQNLRFLILSFPLVLIILFPAAIKFYQRYSFAKKKWVVGVLCLIQILLFVRVFIPFNNLNKLEKQIAGAVHDCPNVWPIYTFEMEGALRSYNVKNEINGLWDKKIDSIQAPLLLIFNEAKFSKQWAGTNVLSNYETIKKRKNIVLKKFSYGWQLSKVE
jgi:hypothetical protein